MTKCRRCDQVLETDVEIEYGICEGCCVDMYEIQQVKREQEYLENDDNFPASVN